MLSACMDIVMWLPAWRMGATVPLCAACGSLYASNAKLRVHFVSSPRCCQYLLEHGDAHLPGVGGKDGHSQAPPVKRGSRVPEVPLLDICPELLAALRALSVAEDQEILDLVTAFVAPWPVLRRTLEKWQAELPDGPLAESLADVLLVFWPEHLCSKVGGKLVHHGPTLGFLPLLSAPIFVRTSCRSALPVLWCGELVDSWVSAWEFGDACLRQVDLSDLPASACVCRGLCVQMPSPVQSDACYFRPGSQSLRRLRLQNAWTLRFLMTAQCLVRTAQEGAPADVGSRNCFTVEFNALFQYHDREESGHLDKEEFLQALQSCHRLLKAELPMESEEAWSQAGGHHTGFVNFSQFAHLAEEIGLALPVGLEIAGATRPCRFRVRLKNNGDFAEEEYTCSCPCFQADARAGGGVLCHCGHKLSMHRSDFAEDTYANIDSRLRTPSPQRGVWLPGEEGLVPVMDPVVFQKLQDLLNDSHKSHDNWTRDRGCRIHGVNGCSWACAAKNRSPVPTGFTLHTAYRNQSPELWRRYCLLKQAIRLECARNQGEFMQPKLLSAADLDSDLDKDCNEWRCFHGSGPDKLRGICESNFRPALAGTGATWKDPGAAKGTPLYGFGFYFAERITKADEYARPLPEDDEHEGLCSVLICRVVGGRTKAAALKCSVVEGACS
ncbi:unnamed protein product [Symbiodinium sp. CCMP2592]|nr:unnamed protein product [Symbiodinium sp. CCMP2592]